jgi:uncharacterized Tic20 family protein
MSEQTPPTPPADPTPTPPAGPVAGAYAGPAPDKDAITMGMLCHLLGIFTGFLGPLIIWLIKKDSSPFVDDQGKEALNFQIVALIATFACFLGFCLAPILIAAVQITRIVFSIIATVKTNQGIAYRYPVTFRLIK